MAKLDSTNTTIPSAPTSDEMEAMWLAARRADEDEAHRRSVERIRRSVHAAIYGEAA
ncbi:MAG TPA: hypothetical protein VGQ99_12045 [Tepidisphaeraceae bacterium]|jgi:hypothetical protein|nr:hypothetical protein [Tepidisphaeraceae bacterium]